MISLKIVEGYSWALNTKKINPVMAAEKKHESQGMLRATCELNRAGMAWNGKTASTRTQDKAG